MTHKMCHSFFYLQLALTYPHACLNLIHSCMLCLLHSVPLLSTHYTNNRIPSLISIKPSALPEAWTQCLAALVDTLSMLCTNDYHAQTTA